MLPALRRNLPLCEIMDPAQVERIDAASMAILEEVGVVFRDPVALADWRRWPTLADLHMFHKLAHMSPALHSTAHHIVEPMDLKVSHRHLHITYSSMKYSDKTFMGMTTSPRNAGDVMEMCAILFGEDVMEETPVVTGNCNGNSPLV